MFNLLTIYSCFNYYFTFKIISSRKILTILIIIKLNITLRMTCHSCIKFCHKTTRCLRITLFILYFSSVFGLIKTVVLFQFIFFVFQILVTFGTSIFIFIAILSFLTILLVFSFTYPWHQITIHFYLLVFFI